VKIIPELQSEAEPPLDHDGSTSALIRRYRRSRVPLATGGKSGDADHT